MLDVESFRSVIMPICEQAERKHCHDYWGQVRKVVSETQEDSDALPILRLFNALLSYHVKPDSPSEAFGPMMVMGGKRSAIPSDLADEERAYLTELLPSIEDPELKARVADVLWELKHGQAQDYAAEAVNAYLDAAKHLDSENFTFATDRYARALRIYASLKRMAKYDDLGARLKDQVLAATRQAQKNGPRRLYQGLVDLIRHARFAESVEFIPGIQALAEQYEAEKNFHDAHDVWLLLGRLHHAAKQPDNTVEAAKKAAETYVKLADLDEASGNPQYMTICSWLQSAVTAYREIVGGKDRAAEIYRRLTALQPRMQEEMSRHSVEINIQEPVEAAIAHVTGRITLGALVRFALHRHPTTIDELRERAADFEKNAPLLSMIAATYHDKKGRVVARKELDEPEENKLYRIASQYRKMEPDLFIDPALAQIRLEHTVSLREWIDFLHSHPFVPPDRRITYARGLYYGFNGDYATAAHILVPQVESSLRYLLEQAGQETSKPRPGGIQEEMTLSELLAHPTIEGMLGKDLAFDLKGFLDEKAGDNFRHLLSHGLLDDDALDSSLPLYFFWLMTYLVFRPLDLRGMDLG